MNIQFDKKWQQTVKDGALSFGVELSELQLDLLAFHAEELIKWNKKFNITAIVDPFDVALKHFIDSIAISPLISNRSELNNPPSDLNSLKIIDLGSGGGFPGMPLKIVKPYCNVIMVDSSQKKVNFLNYLISQSLLIEKKVMDQNKAEKIKNGVVKAVHGRAEEIGKDAEYFNQFDFVVSRAFTALDKFTDMALPFLKQNGVILAMKGDLKEDELAPIINQKKLQIKIHQYTLPFEQHKRCVVKIRY